MMTCHKDNLQPKIFINVTSWKQRSQLAQAMGKSQGDYEGYFIL
jgi:hypothetical protein